MQLTLKQIKKIWHDICKENGTDMQWVLERSAEIKAASNPADRRWGDKSTMQALTELEWNRKVALVNRALELYASSSVPFHNTQP